MIVARDWVSVRLPRQVLFTAARAYGLVIAVHPHHLDVRTDRIPSKVVRINAQDCHKLRPETVKMLRDQGGLKWLEQRQHEQDVRDDRRG